MRVQWFGHVARMPSDRLPNNLLSWHPRHGQRSVGAPPTNWHNSVLNDINALTNDDVTLAEAISLAQNRAQWSCLTRGIVHKKKQSTQAVERL